MFRTLLCVAAFGVTGLCFGLGVGSSQTTTVIALVIVLAFGLGYAAFGDHPFLIFRPAFALVGLIAIGIVYWIAGDGINSNNTLGLIVAGAVATLIALNDALNPSPGLNAHPAGARR
jgi:hypothetical protein